MNIRVLFFAHLKEKATAQPLHLAVEEGACIRDLKILLVRQYPALQGALDHVIASIDREFARDDTPLREGAEVAFFPPVSGGSDEMALVQLTRQEILVDPVVRQLAVDVTGGICLFTGIVRGHTLRGGPVRTIRLQYEAYETMATEKMVQIVREIRERWPAIDKVVMVQRVGEIQPGEISVLVACSGSHRDVGIFDAVHYGIDRLKEIVPIWKKEFTDNGEYWVEGNYFPSQDE